MRLVILPLYHEKQPNARPSTHPIERYGWSTKVILISKKTFSMLEMVNLGWSLGGEAVTLVRVSRIEVREGTIKFPVLVWSQ